MTDLEKFEMYLLNKREFLVGMLQLIIGGGGRDLFVIQIELLDDIIHHFNTFVKGEVSNGLGENEE